MRCAVCGEPGQRYLAILPAVERSLARRRVIEEASECGRPTIREAVMTEPVTMRIFSDYV